MLELSPDFGVAISPDTTYMDLRERAQAACRSIELLVEKGLDIAPTQEDVEAAAAIVSAYAANPEATSKHVSNARASTMAPASLLTLRTYLDEFGQTVVRNAAEIRYLVTNRLLEESRNPDPRVRIRALELLGKISDVGLFTDRSEVLVTHQSTDELRAKLKEKLQRLAPRPVPPSDVRNNIIDVDVELGFVEKDITPAPGAGTDPHA
jgi:hypothetical protein